jgi:NitT/TauT family transport system ATP-binding protein
MLEIKSISKSFMAGDGSRRAILRDISFSVPKFQFLCLLGPSGCGKTTLLRIAAGLTEADQGELVLDGSRIRGPGRERSFVFQSYGLLPWRTVIENVELGLEIGGMNVARRRAICREHIERVRLSGFENHFPHQLSGGMQQRVALARAFAKDPKLLLMDEPFAAVDAQTREHLQRELLAVWSSKQTTVLFVTHSIEEALILGGRVIVMSRDAGRIVADITPELSCEARLRSEIETLPAFERLRRDLRGALMERAA